MSCLECKFHGPPVSDYTGPKPCGECIPYKGFPKKEPVPEPPADISDFPGGCREPCAMSG